MQAPSKLIIRLEIIWWSVTAILVLVILLPLRPYWNTYLFFWMNVVYIIAFITFTRYTFLLPYTFLAHRQKLKVILFFFFIPIVFLLIQELNNFQTYLDNYGLESLLGLSDYQSNKSLIDYTYNEMLLFSVGSMVSGIVLPLRLLLSVWRNRNRGTV